MCSISRVHVRCKPPPPPPNAEIRRIGQLLTKTGTYVPDRRKFLHILTNRTIWVHQLGRRNVMSASLPAAPTLRRSPAKFKDTNVWTLSAHVFKKDWLTKAENHQQQPLNQKEYSTLHPYRVMYLICVYILNQNENIYILCDRNLKISSTKCKYCILLLQFIGLPLGSNSSWSAIIQVQFWFQNWVCGRQYYKSFVRYTLGWNF